LDQYKVKAFTPPRSTLKQDEWRPQSVFPFTGHEVEGQDSDSDSERLRERLVSDSTGSSCTPRTDDLRKQLQVAEAGLLSAKLQIQQLEQIAKEASADKKSKKTQKTPGLNKRKKHQRSRERLIVTPAARDPPPTTPREASARDGTTDRKARGSLAASRQSVNRDISTDRQGTETAVAQFAVEDQHSMVAEKKVCGPGGWFFGFFRSISRGTFCDAVSGRHSVERSATQNITQRDLWQEGDDVEYLAIDVVHGEKSMKWVRARVAAVRTRIVRDMPRRELRVTYYANKRHQETTYWMVPSDLRLRVPR
jgi:hypothetical protein